MKTIKVECYGITRDLFGESELVINLNEANTVSELKAYLVEKAPSLKELASLNIAVNQEYADDELLLKENDEIVLIPPVSGG